MKLPCQSSIATLTSAETAYDFSLGGTDTTWYLPDGFRGIGSIGWGMTSATGDTEMADRTFILKIPTCTQHLKVV